MILKSHKISSKRNLQSQSIKFEKGFIRVYLRASAANMLLSLNQCTHTFISQHFQQ